jgi:hypothetical protein
MDYNDICLKIKRLDEKCKTHDRQLLLCPVKNCTGCYFIHVCKDNKICPYCTGNVLRSISLGSERIWNDEGKPIAQKLSNLKMQRKKIERNAVEEDDSFIKNKLEELDKIINRFEEQLTEIKSRMK